MRNPAHEKIVLACLSNFLSKYFSMFVSKFLKNLFTIFAGAVAAARGLGRQGWPTGGSPSAATAPANILKNEETTISDSETTVLDSETTELLGAN